MLDKETYETKKMALMSGFSTKKQLKSAIELFDKMDPIDALRAAKELFGLMSSRCDVR